MTTLVYIRYPDLSPEDAAVAAKFGEALACKPSDPDRSNRTLREIAAARGYAAAHAHRELAYRYARGDSVPEDAARALEHMMAAIELGDTVAMGQLASEYEREPCEADEIIGKQFVAHNRQEALRWYRRAVALGDISARTSLADCLRAGRYAKDCTAEEVEEIASNYEAVEEWALLGAFYCDDLLAPGFPHEHVEQALRCCRLGREAGIRWCDAKLLEWENEQQAPLSIAQSLHARPAPDAPAVSPPAAAATRRSKEWTLMDVLLAPVALALWAAIGTAVLGFLVSVQSVTGPIFLGLAALYGIVRALSRRKK